VPYQKRVADILQDRATAAAHTATLRQFPRERFSRVEYRGHLALVPGEDNALGQHLGDQDQPLRREALQAYRAAWRNLLILLTGQFDDSNFLVAPRERPYHA
jgi:hypothetical protein